MAVELISQIRGIIWDWNGTLLNDTILAVESMNSMLCQRGLPGDLVRILSDFSIQAFYFENLLGENADFFYPFSFYLIIFPICLKRQGCYKCTKIVHLYLKYALR